MRLNNAQVIGAAALTDVELVPARTGRAIAVKMVTFTTSVANQISIEAGTTNLKWRGFHAANGGMTVAAPASGGGHDEPWLFTTAPGEALTITSTGAGNLFAHVLYAYI
jgi:hypothetical protein